MRVKVDIVLGVKTKENIKVTALKVEDVCITIVSSVKTFNVLSGPVHFSYQRGTV